jgi:alkylhydroperoxidase family enzyme
MNARLNLSGSPLAAKSMKYLASASQVVIEGSTLPKSTENMVMLRASQINGCEQGTRMADAASGVTDEAWANAARHYDEEQLAALVCLIALINASNRLGVIPQLRGGDYQPGQHG